MKKQLISMTVLMSLLSSVSAMAASGGYNAGENKLTVDTEVKANTVIVAKSTESDLAAEDIVYIGQSNGGFSSTDLLLKANPTDGFYTVILGNSDGSTSKANFVIGGSAAFAKTAELTKLDGYEIAAEDGTLTKAYVSADNVKLSDIKTIVVTCDGKTVYSEVGTELSGDGSAMVGVKLTGIADADKDKIGVFISSDKLSEKTLVTD